MIKLYKITKLRTYEYYGRLIHIKSLVPTLDPDITIQVIYIVRHRHLVRATPPTTRTTDPLISRGPRSTRFTSK